MRRSEIRQNRLQTPLVYGTPNLHASLSHVHAAADITSGRFDPARLGSGTATNNTYLRGDGSWQEISGGPGGTVTYSHAHSTGDITSGVFTRDRLGSLSASANSFLRGTGEWTEIGWASAVHVHAAADITSGIFNPARLGSGTATSTTYLRGDGTWAAVSGSADGSHSSHQTLSDLQGGGGGEYYHFTSAQWAGLVAAGWASATHTHDYSALYAALSHTHSYTGIYALATHTHDAADIVTGVLARERLGSLSATQNTFLRGTGEWTDIGWASSTHTHAYEGLYAPIDHTHSYTALYASVAHTHNYLGLDGGTLTGNLTITGMDESTGAAIRIIGALGNNANVFFAENNVQRAAVIWRASDGALAWTAYDTSGLNGKTVFRGLYGSTAELYFDGSKKLETTSGGVVVTGIVNASTDFYRNGASLGTIYASATHTHAYESLYASIGHTHSYSAIYASTGHVHAASDVTSGIFARDRLGSLSASTGTFLRGTGEWTGIGWASATHTHSAGDITNGTVAPARLGSGTPDSTTFLRGDSSWVTVAAGTEYITRVDTATGSCGTYLTWQQMPSNSAAISDISGVVVMSTLGLTTGTYAIKYNLLYQSSVAGNGVGFYLRHTGTVTTFASMWTFVSTGGAAATGIGDQAAATSAGQLVEGKAERANNTCSSPTTGVDTNAAVMLGTLDGTIIATTGGDLHLKVRSETAGGTVTVMAGTCLQLSKIA